MKMFKEVKPFIFMIKREQWKTNWLPITIASVF